MPNIKAGGSVRSFLYDPDCRYGPAHSYDPSTRPTERAVQIMATVLQSNILVKSLFTWGAALENGDPVNARLELKWPGSDPSVRAFTVTPNAATVAPRSVYITSLDEDEPCYINSFEPLYPLVNWPVLFPNGKRVLLKNGQPLFGTGAACNIKHATMYFTYQPLRYADARFVTVPTVATWKPVDDRVVLRRASRSDLAGKVGDELILDMHLCYLDLQKQQLCSKSVQRRMQRAFDSTLLLGDAPPAADGAAEPTARATYLPSSVIGSPRYMTEACGNSMYTAHQLGRGLFFVTITNNTKAPEITSRLACFDGAVQDVFHRASLHSDVFEHNVSNCFLTAFRTGTVMRNIGRPLLQSQVFTFSMTSLVILVCVMLPYKSSVSYRAQYLSHCHRFLRVSGI